ncbi:MAG: MotA/TolQ/ExbB proton channel family protein [Verrucomicrobiota bacterium]
MTVIPLLAQATNQAAEIVADKAKESSEVIEQVTTSAEPGFFSELIHSGALGFLLEGGLFMWPILLLGILALGVVIERWRSLKMLNVDSSEMRNQVIDLLIRDKVEEALAYTDSKRGPVAAILANGLRKYVVLRRLNYDPARIEEQVVKSMENYGVHIVAALERHLPVLAITSSVSPMLGFLGTVQGMIVSFKNIVETMGEVNIVEAAASGIQVALLTTCFGLIIGIPAFIAFNYFSSVINGFVLEVEETAQELMEVVTLQVTLEQQAHEV